MECMQLVSIAGAGASGIHECLLGRSFRDIHNPYRTSILVEVRAQAYG